MSSLANTWPAGFACLTPDRALDFAAGRSTEAERCELDLHVDQCSDCQQLMAAAIAALCAEGAPTPLGPNLWLAERYLLLRALGRGGMGEVFEAFDRVLQERVALKVLSAELRDHERALRHFKAEVQLARRIAHRNVCRVFDLGVHEGTDGPVYFLTMELIEGETLRRHLRAGPLPLARVAAWTRELAEGLAAAHLAGVLHRDLKSDNVLLRGGASAVITDFGLAQPLRDDSASLGRQLVGSAAYMAPEQVCGAPLSPATDLYALGVVTFEMLTGELPFRGATPFATAFSRLTETAPAPSALRPTLPTAWDALVSRCLAREPRDRYGSAAELLEALDRLEAPDRRRRGRTPLPLLALCAAVILQPGAAETPAVIPASPARGVVLEPPRLPPAGRCEPSEVAPPPRAAPIARRPTRPRRARLTARSAERQQIVPTPIVIESVDALIDPFE